MRPPVKPEVEPVGETGKPLFQIGFEFSGSKSHQIEADTGEEALEILEKIKIKDYLDIDGVQVIGKPRPFVNVLRR